MFNNIISNAMIKDTDSDIDIETEKLIKSLMEDHPLKNAVSLKVRWNADGCRFIESVTEIPNQE